MRMASAGLLVFLICAALLAFPGSGLEPGVVEAEALLAAVLDAPGGGGVGERWRCALGCAGSFPRKGEELRRLLRAGEADRGTAATDTEAMLVADLLSQTSLHRLVRSRRFL